MLVRINQTKMAAWISVQTIIEEEEGRKELNQTMIPK